MESVREGNIVAARFSLLAMVATVYGVFWCVSRLHIFGSENGVTNQTIPNVSVKGNWDLRYNSVRWSLCCIALVMLKLSRPISINILDG